MFMGCKYPLSANNTALIGPGAAIYRTLHALITPAARERLSDLIEPPIPFHRRTHHG